MYLQGGVAESVQKVESGRISVDVGAVWTAMGDDDKGRRIRVGDGGTSKDTKDIGKSKRTHVNSGVLKGLRWDGEGKWRGGRGRCCVKDHCMRTLAVTGLQQEHQRTKHIEDTCGGIRLVRARVRRKSACRRIHSNDSL